MSSVSEGHQEGNLQAPIRHPLNWKDGEFYSEPRLMEELERVFDICHGCRRCVSLCNAFPTLFDLVDNSETMEVDGVDKENYWQVVDNCYLCDLCYMTKCPYVPPHEWNVDFPHLMLRAKAVKNRRGQFKTRDKLLSSTDTLGKLAGIPVVAQAVNASNSNSTMRKLLEKVLGVHTDAIIPKYHTETARRRLAKRKALDYEPLAVGSTQGRVALFTTCYGNYNEPELAMDLVKVFEHNDLVVTLASKERCCGMPKLELGDLDAVDQAKKVNISALSEMIDQGWDIVAPVPSCVLMFKQELPLMYPDDPEVIKVSTHIFDPFEYLMLRHKAGMMKTDFQQSLGKIAYHAPCHLRVQNMGLKTRDLLQLVPGTELEVIERCSGHDGTYAVKQEFHEFSMKICRPVVERVKRAEVDHYSSDCPMAGHQIENGLRNGRSPEHPLTLLRLAYGL
jgi:Fe-S oxidoreductase